MVSYINAPQGFRQDYLAESTPTRNNLIPKFAFVIQKSFNIDLISVDRQQQRIIPGPVKEHVDSIAPVEMDTNLLERVIAGQYDLPDAEIPGVANV